MSNIKVIEEIYASFGRGDIPAILRHLAEDVEWEYAYRAAPNPVPWLQPRREKTGVAEFFKSLQDNLDIHRFGVNALAEGANLVVGIIDIEMTVKRTGKRIAEHDEAHIWRFNDAGMVVRFRHCADTYQQALALDGT